MATQTRSPFETLARVIEHLDDDDRSVRRTEAAGSGENGSLRATVEVSAGAVAGDGPDLEPTDAAVDDGLAVTFRAPAFPDAEAALSPASPPVSVAATDVRVDGDEVVVTLSVTIGDADEPDAVEDDAGVADERAASAFGRRSADAHDGDDVRADDGASTNGAPDGGEERSSADSAPSSADPADGSDAAEPVLEAVRDESVPAYDDTPYLRRLYETCDTFAEMSDRIEMDVSAETVRRYMTEAGVHSPTSYGTADGASDSAGGSDAGADVRESGGAADPDPDPEESAALPDEQLVADGIGLPEALTLHDVVDAVVDARTVHEVQRALGLEYDRTRQLLTQLNVLDLVMGRVSGDAGPAVTVDVVADRIRQCAPDTA
jgi:hypothetical protein